MRKLTLAEKKIFQYIDNNIDVDAPNTKSLVIKLLKDNFGFTSGEALKFFINWYYSSGYDYETYELDEDKNPLFDFIQAISTITTQGELDYFIDELYDKDNILYRRLNGEYFNIACQYSGNIPCLNFDLDGITIELDSENWEEYFSGLYEDDWWRYYESHSNYSDYYEDFDSDEFNYMSYNDDTIDILGDIATLSGKLNWPGKDGGATRSEDISKFLSEVLPSNYFEEVVNEYLSELSYVVSDNRRKATRDYYEEEVKYDTNRTRCEFARYCIHIPYSDLLDIIDGEDLLSLSDLKDVGVNGSIDLGDVWYDTNTVSGDNEKLAKEFNYILERVIKRIVEKDGIDLEEVNRIKEKVITMLDTLNLEKGIPTMTGHWYNSEDGKIRLHTDEIDFKENKISFWYNKKRHKVPIDEFPNWVMGSVMDLQESFKNKKKLIKEQRENITKISIFDFDGTLMDTPNAEEGKKEWEEFTGEVYPHKGWWSKPESLDDAVFDIQPIPSTVEDYKIEMDNPNALVIMLTGRLPRQSDQVEELLSMHDLYFDEYHYKNNGDTLSSKLNTIRTLVNRYPNVTNIEMWEDRVAHVSEFEKFGDEINIPIKVNFVGGETEIINESEDREWLLYKKVSDILKPPFIKTLEGMGFDLTQSEKILYKFFGERVYIYDDSATNHYGEVIDPDQYWVMNEDGRKVYEEEDDWWAIWKYDEGGNTIYYEDSYSGVVNLTDRINESTEENKDRLYDRVLGILNEPPYVSTLLSMGFNMFQIEEILKLKFQKENIKLDIRSHHNTSTERDFKDLANGEHWLETNVNIDSGSGWENVYFENMHGQWIISRYDKNGNQTYYENWVGFWWKRKYNDRGDLISYEDSNGNDTPIEDLGRMNESTEKTTLYDRMLPLMNRPYVDFLKKNGFDWDMIESQFEKMYGEDIKQDHYEYNDGTWDYRVRTIDDKLLYYETTKESVIPYWEEVKYPNEKEVWFMDKYDRAWVKKYNDDGKLIFSYGKHSDTWEDSPEEIKNDPFFDKDGTDILNESTEKNVVDNYLMKVAQMIKKPYVYHIKQHSIDKGYYKQILSYIFNKDIHLDISFGQYNVYDPDNGKRIYSEFNDIDGWEYKEYNKYGLSYEENSDGYWREVSYDDNGRIYKMVNSKGEVQTLQPPYGENINESTEKNREIYHQRLSQIVDKPYFKSLRDMGVNFKDWNPTLSILFDRNIILDGVSLNHTRILDAETGEEIYGEWDYNDGWVFNDYITGEYKNTLPV